MFESPGPLRPTEPFPVVTDAFISAIPTVLPSEPTLRLAALDDAAALTPGAYMAPNWVFRCGANQSCVTNRYDTSNPAIDASCVAQSARCVDSVTRGLLSGLQPLLHPSETLFPEEARVLVE